MGRPVRGRLAAAAIVTALMMTLPAPASAHVKKVIGQVRLSFGWGDEPAYSGSENFVEVSVSDATRAPVNDLGGELTVAVSFGSEQTVLPLLPTEELGEFRAPLVPTRPGTYAFHITGTVKGQAIDTRATCSESTFSCVADASEIQFPVKDPSNGQLGERLSRAFPRAEDELRSTADRTAWLAIAAIAVAALALAAAIWLGARTRRKGA
jgi:hypothetical protein